MKKLLLILMMLLISVTLACLSKKSQNLAPTSTNINGIWIGTRGAGTVTFEFRTEGKELYGLFQGAGGGDEIKEIQRGNIKKDEISFEVPMTEGMRKLITLYKGKILNDNEIELTATMKSRGPRNASFGSSGAGGGFNSGFGGGLGGFGGASQESPPFVIKRKR
ncbi:hypothetical protein ACFL1N_12755 [Thermodesulfobacteriota bacterium]